MLFLKSLHDIIDEYILLQVTILITDDNPRPYLEQTPVINIQEHTQRPNDGEIVRVKAYDGVNANGVVKVCDCTFRLDTNRGMIYSAISLGDCWFNNRIGRVSKGRL